MAYTATDVKNLRERTGAGMMDCKKALDDTGGDMEAAGGGRGGRAVNGTRGVAVEVNAEPDFVAQAAQFQEFVRKTAEVALAQGSDDVEPCASAASVVLRTKSWNWSFLDFVRKTTEV